jgi:hypothetical protein
MEKIILSISTPDPAVVDSSLLNGSGNGFIGVGTGNIYYGQVGYLFVKTYKSSYKGRLQVMQRDKLPT